MIMSGERLSVDVSRYAAASARRAARLCGSCYRVEDRCRRRAVCWLALKLERRRLVLAGMLLLSEDLECWPAPRMFSLSFLLALGLAGSVVAESWYSPAGVGVYGAYSNNPVWLNGSTQTLAFQTEIPRWGLTLYQVDQPHSTMLSRMAAYRSTCAFRHS